MKKLPANALEDWATPCDWEDQLLVPGSSVPHGDRVLLMPVDLVGPLCTGRGLGVAHAGLNDWEDQSPG